MLSDTLFQTNNHYLNALFQTNNHYLNALFQTNNHYLNALFQTNNHYLNTLFQTNNHYFNALFQTNNHYLNALFQTNSMLLVFIVSAWRACSSRRSSNDDVKTEKSRPEVLLWGLSSGFMLASFLSHWFKEHLSRKSRLSEGSESALSNCRAWAIYPMQSRACSCYAEAMVFFGRSPKNAFCGSHAGYRTRAGSVQFYCSMVNTNLMPLPSP